MNRQRNIMKKVCLFLGNWSQIWNCSVNSQSGNGSFQSGYSEQAKKYYEESLDIRMEIGDKNGIAESIKNVGNVAYAQEIINRP